MSDQKKLNKRLNDLFADLEDETLPKADAEETLSGWTWEIDASGNYRKCSPEVSELLGVNAEDFIGESLSTFMLALESQRNISASLEEKRSRTELTLQFIDSKDEPVNVRIYLFYTPAEDGAEESWRGFTQLIQSDDTTKPKSIPSSPNPIDSVTISSLSIPEGIAFEGDKFYSVSSPYSAIGKQSLEQRQSLVHEATDDAPAALAVPIELQEQALGLLEFIDENPNRRWSQEEQLLVEEVAGQLSLALENARLFEEAQQRSSELALINRVVSQVAASLDVNESMQIVTTELANALDMQVNIALLNPNGKSLTLVADYSPRQENPFVVGYEIPIEGNPSTERVFETKAPVIIDDPQTNPLISSLHDLMRSLNVQNMGIFPMIFQNEIFGTVGLYILDEGRHLTQGEIQLVNTILVQAATAVQNARLFEQLQTRSAQLLTAAEISRAASSILEPHPLINQAVNLIQDRFNLYYAGIFLVDEGGTITGESNRWAVLRAGTGEAGRIQVERGHKLEVGGESMIGQCVSLAEARISQLAPEEMQRFANPLLPDTQSEMALPLISRGKVIGAMTIQSTEPGAFTQEGISVLQTMADQVANALQNAHLFDQTQQNASELSILNDMRLTLSRQLDISEIIQTIHQYTSQLMNTSYFFVSLYNADEDIVSFPLVVEDNKFGEIAPMKKSKGLTQHVIDSKEPLLIYENVEEVIKELGLDRIVIGEPAKSWLGVPLLIGDEVLGVIATQNATRPRVFTNHHLDLLVLIARQSAIALRNAQLFAQTQEALAETEALLNITSVASRSLELKSILDDVLALVLNAADFDSGLITILNPKTEKLELISAILPDEMIRGIEETGFEDTLCEMVYLRKEPVVVNNFEEDSSVEATSLLEEGFRAYLGVPLESRGEVLGTLCTFRRSTIDPRDVGSLSLLQGVGQQVGVAVENANLFEQAQRQLKDISTIQETTAGLSAALTLDGVVNILLAHLVGAVRADTASVFSLDGPNMIRAGVYPTSGDSSPNIGEAIALKDYPLTQRVIETQEAFAVAGDDEKLQPHAREAFIAAGIAANATIPIVGPEGVLGTISVSRNHPAENFSDTELSLMSTLANQAAVAILNARSYDRVQEVAEEMATLFEVSQAISSAPVGVSEIAEVVARNFVGVLNIPECSISLLNKENNSLEIVVDLYIDDEGKKIVREEEIDKIESLQQYPATARVLHTLEPLVIQASDPDADPAELAYMEKYEVTTLAILPLAVKGQSFGVIELESFDEEHQYTESELNLAITLSNQAAVALDNARLYDEQREITEQLRELDSLKSQFLANMSHELRTPLNSIIGFSRVIMKGIDGPVTEQQSQDLSAIYNAGQHLLNMINDILDISKIDAGKMELAFEDLELPQIVESVLSTTRGLVKDKPVELCTDIQDGIPIIHADPTRIRQVLLNLLSNAAKFTDEGSITVAASEQVGSRGRPEVKIAVKDTGVGIAIEDQQDLFEPFTQVDGSATRSTGGTGLGLSITRLLVDLHDGEIGVESTPGEGSTFYFTIPILPEEKLTILSIDGDPQVTQLYQRYLEDTKYQIVSLLLPSNALNMALELQPFAITLDTNLPEQDGWEILQTLQEDPNTQDIPILVCSLLDVAEEAKDAGATSYLPKPILKDDLVKALNNIQLDEDEI